jgi:hypothetical protein
MVSCKVWPLKMQPRASQGRLKAHGRQYEGRLMAILLKVESGIIKKRHVLY